MGWEKSYSEQLRATWMVSCSLGRLKSREEGNEEGEGGRLPPSLTRIVWGAGSCMHLIRLLCQLAHLPGHLALPFCRQTTLGLLCPPSQRSGLLGSQNTCWGGKEGALLSPGVQGSLLDPQVTLWNDIALSDACP